MRSFRPLHTFFLYIDSFIAVLAVPEATAHQHHIMGSAPFAQEAGRFFIILFANVPMGLCGFGDAIVMHMALTLCGMVRVQCAEAGE
jgi:hypothetical protein